MNVYKNSTCFIRWSVSNELIRFSFVCSIIHHSPLKIISLCITSLFGMELLEYYGKIWNLWYRTKEQLQIEFYIILGSMLVIYSLFFTITLWCEWCVKPLMTKVTGVLDIHNKLICVLYNFQNVLNWIQIAQQSSLFFDPIFDHTYYGLKRFIMA